MTKVLNPKNLQVKKNSLQAEVEKLYADGKSLRMIRTELIEKFPEMSSERFEELTELYTLKQLTKSYNSSTIARQLIMMSGEAYLKCSDSQRIFYISGSGNKFLFEDDLTGLKELGEEAPVSSKKISPFDQMLKLEKMDTFHKISSFLKRFIYLQDERQYELLTSYIIMTYCFEIFNSIPYLMLNGSKGTGKTTTMNVMRDLSYKGSMTSDITASSLFRFVQSEKPTLFLDEAEDLGKRNTGNSVLLKVLNSGYEKNGNVRRNERVEIEGVTYLKPVYFSTYGPKVLAAINSLSPATEDRCIVVELKAAPEDWQLQNYMPEDMDIRQELEALKDLLIVSSLKISSGILDLIKSPENLELDFPLKNRAYDRWFPLLSIAKLLDLKGNALNSLKELCRNDIDAKQMQDATTPENMCRKIIAEYIRENTSRLVEKTAQHFVLLADDIYKVIRANDLYNSYSNKGQLTLVLKKLGVSSSRRRIKGELTPVYSIPLGLTE